MNRPPKIRDLSTTAWRLQLVAVMLFLSYGVRCTAQTDSTQTDSVETKLSFDFGITRDWNINAWPIFKNQKSPDKKELQILYPLFSKSADFAQHTKHFQFVPFAITDSSDAEIDKRFLSLYYPSVFRYQKLNHGDSAITSYKFLELAPRISCFNIGRAPDGMFMENNLFFFISYKRDLIKQKTHFVVFPLYWYYANRTDTSLAIPPLYFQSKSKDYQSENIGLLYSSTRTSQESRKSLFPIWWSSKMHLSNDTIVSNTLFPLFWAKRSHQRNHTVLFPLIFQYDNPHYRSFTLFPLFSAGSSPDDSRAHLDLLGLYWSNRSKGFSSRVLFPIWWNSRIYMSDDTLTSNTFFPIYWSTRSKTEQNLTLFPLVYSRKNPRYQAFTLFPLYSEGHSPNREEQHCYLFPSYWKHQNPVESVETLFPLWWKTEEFSAQDTVTKRLLLPLYWSMERKNRRADVIFPLFWSSRQYLPNDTVRSATLFPLWWSERSKQKHNRILFPVLFSYKSSFYQSLTVVPLFSYGHSTDHTTSHLSLLPIYWHHRSDQGVNNVIFPLWWNRRSFLGADTTTTNLFFPVYWSSKNRYSKKTVLFPILLSTKDTAYESLTILPLFSKGHSADHQHRHLFTFPTYWRFDSPQSCNQGVLPIWWDFREFRAQDTLVQKSLFPIYWVYRNKSISNRILLPLYVRLKNPDFETTTYFPFYSHGHTADSSSKYYAITPFYWNLIQQNERQEMLFPFYWHRKSYDQSGVTEKTTLFPIYWSSQSLYENHRVIFPLVFSFKDTAYQSLSVLPFFSKGHNASRTKSHFNIFPLFWQSKDTSAEEITLLPVYWSSRSKDSRSDLFFPFVYLTQSPSWKTTNIFPLLFYGKTRDSKFKYCGITPLFWHFEDAELHSKYNILFPLFWNSKTVSNNDTIRSTTLLPLYWSLKDRKRNHKVLFPVIFSFNNQRYRSFTLFPLFSRGHSLINDNHYLMITPLAGHFSNKQDVRTYFFPLFNYHKTQTLSHLSILYFLYRHTTSGDSSSTSILWPLCERDRRPGYAHFRIAPFVWQTITDTSTLSSVQPLYYAYDSPTKQSFNLLWMLYRYENNKGSSVSNSLLWKLYTHDKYANGDFETRVLQELYARVKTAEKTQFTLFPFYSSTKTANGSMSKSVFFSFYNHFKRYIPEIKEYYEEERYFWLVRVRSNYQKIKRDGHEKYLNKR